MTNIAAEKYGLLPVLELTPGLTNIVSKVTIDEDSDEWREFVGSELAGIWDEKVAEYELTKFGDCSYITGYSHEVVNNEIILDLKVSPSQYPEHLATVDLLKEHPELVRKYYDLYRRRGVEGVVKYSMPSSMKINVAVINEWGSFLAVKRSSKVGYKRQIWTVGPNETLETKYVNGRIVAEGFEDSAVRCLKEELGMSGEDYQDLKTSYLAYDIRTLQLKIYAHANIKLGPEQIKERISKSQSLWEAEAFQWLPLTVDFLNELKDNNLTDNSGKKWSSSSIISITELLERYRSLA